MSQLSISGRVINEQRAAIPSEPSNRQGDLSHTRYSRVAKQYDSSGSPPQHRKEGDLILGAGSHSAVGTLVERTTRFVLLLHLAGDHSAPTVEAAMRKDIAALPNELMRSVTWDQGSEMANHRAITVATGVPIYFCDPHSPWMRGSNENTNGLLRQYMPKGTDLSKFSDDDLLAIQRSLNGRPRKTLDYMMPEEKLAELVALTP